MNQKGFTLIEVLVGLIFLAIGLLSVTSMQITSIKSNYFTKNVTEATALAKSKLEYLKNLPYNSSELNSGNHEAPVSGTIFSINYNVVEDAVNVKKTISVTTLWTDKVQRSVTLKALRLE